MLFGILLACLSWERIRLQLDPSHHTIRNPYLGRLSNFLTNNLPLVGFVFFDCFTEFHRLPKVSLGLLPPSRVFLSHKTYFVLCELSIMHVLDGIRVSQVPGSSKGLEPSDLSQSYLVPMLLYTTLGSCRESLRRVPAVRDMRTSRILYRESLRTLAISLQLRPASRMVFKRCSSSAVQGVLVRPFFFGGGSTGAGRALGSASMAPPAGFSGVAIIAEELVVGDGGRLREAVAGCCCGGRGGAFGMGMPSKAGTRWNGWICCWARRCDGALVVEEVLIRLEVGGELAEVDGKR